MVRGSEDNLHYRTMISCKLGAIILCIPLICGGADGTRTHHPMEIGYGGDERMRVSEQVDTHITPHVRGIVQNNVQIPPFDVSVEYCRKQPIPTVCLNELVREAHPGNLWNLDPVPEDNSAIVTARGVVRSWDCKDYAKTLAALVKTHAFGEAKILSCPPNRAIGTQNGHRYVLVDGVYFDHEGGHRRPSKRYLCD